MRMVPQEFSELRIVSDCGREAVGEERERGWVYQMTPH
jgi:hypothetical protein